MHALWPRGFVDESNLTKHIWLIRKALGEGEHDARWIETVPKLGYRFVASVQRVARSPAPLVTDVIGAGIRRIQRAGARSGARCARSKWRGESAIAEDASLIARRHAADTAFRRAARIVCIAVAAIDCRGSGGVHRRVRGDRVLRCASGRPMCRRRRMFAAVRLPSSSSTISRRTPRTPGSDRRSAKCSRPRSPPAGSLYVLPDELVRTGARRSRRAARRRLRGAKSVDAAAATRCRLCSERRLSRRRCRRSTARATRSRVAGRAQRHRDRYARARCGGVGSADAGRASGRRIARASRHRDQQQRRAATGRERAAADRRRRAPDWFRARCVASQRSGACARRVARRGRAGARIRARVQLSRAGVVGARLRRQGRGCGRSRRPRTRRVCPRSSACRSSCSSRRRSTPGRRRPTRRVLWSSCVRTIRIIACV